MNGPRAEVGLVRTHRLGPDAEVHTWIGPANSHLLVCGGAAVLIDCADAGLAARIRTCGLPAPQAVLHTRVTPETCAEAGAFDPAPSLVHEDDLPLVATPQDVQRAADRQTADLPGWSVHMGAETYGIAGWQTRFPILPPPPRVAAFRSGDTLPVGDHRLECVPLPVFGPGACGFRLLDPQGHSLAFFCGDLVDNGPFLRDLFSLEKAYGLSRLPDVPALLAKAAGFGPVPWFPLHGATVPDGAACAHALAGKIAAYHEALRWNPLPALPQRPELPLLGRWRHHGNGVYQLVNGGNSLIFIRPDGSALMVDPGPCDFENPRRGREFIADLERFEKKAGLKSVDLVLLTHFHGDHIDCTDLVRSRYPGCRVAAWSPVADAVEHPERYPYCARLPWYGLGKTAVGVDVRLTRREPFDWQGTAIQTLHLPGHALIHAGYLLHFGGKNILCAGDSVQSNGEVLGLHALPGNHSVPDENEGCLACFLTLCGRDIDLNLGGHGTWFEDASAVYAASRDRMHHALPSLRAMLSDGDLHRAFVPAHFPRWTSTQLA